MTLFFIIVAAVIVGNLALAFLGVALASLIENAREIGIILLIVLGIPALFFILGAVFPTSNPNTVLGPVFGLFGAAIIVAAFVKPLVKLLLLMTIAVRRQFRQTRSIYFGRM